MIDDGTVSRLAEQTFRWTAADPSLRWFRQNAAGMDVHDRGRLRRGRRARAAGADVGAAAARGRERRHRPPEVLPRDDRHDRAASTVDISRTGYTGDLGYEIWMPAPTRGARVGRADGRRASPFDIKPAGMLALDVARDRGRTAADRSGFLQQQEGDDRVAEVHAVRDGAGPAGQPGQGALHRPAARCATSTRRGHARQIVGLEIDWTEVERIYEKLGLAPAVGATASRVAVPVYRDGRQVGKATSTTWSPVLKRMIALATVDRPHYAEGTALQIEMTVEAVRHRVGATVVKTPFFNPPRKTATPPDS